MFAPPAADDDGHLLETVRAVRISDEVEHIHADTLSTSPAARWDTAQVSNVDRLAREFFTASTPPAPLSGLAVASISLGALTIFPLLLALLVRSGGVLAVLLHLAIVGVPAVLAIVFGHVSSGAIRRGERRGLGLARGGLTLGYLALLAPLGVTYLLALFGLGG